VATENPSADAPPFQNPTDAELRELLSSARVIAMVGASEDPDRAASGIFRRLQQVGYRVLPVNPNRQTVFGERSYARLADIQGAVDIVNVFRGAEHTPQLADEAVAIGARCLWLQLGIENAEAARRARAGGLTVVMNACIAVVHRALDIGSKGVA
jgi:predicted CoA-binding protein